MLIKLVVIKNILQFILICNPFEISRVFLRQKIRGNPCLLVRKKIKKSIGLRITVIGQFEKHRLTSYLF